MKHTKIVFETKKRTTSQGTTFSDLANGDFFYFGACFAISKTEKRLRQKHDEGGYINVDSGVLHTWHNNEQQVTILPRVTITIEEEN
ncbi:hypothetical protein LCGC14_2134150 [marine sediment metagenome]|uniref:Uncharacterized protein n=1 Tax=marine sediment metagenome TaxID=412755 RepID=A0A0F9E0K5_9ZZZZ